MWTFFSVSNSMARECLSRTNVCIVSLWNANKCSLCRTLLSVSSHKKKIFIVETFSFFVHFFVTKRKQNENLLNHIITPSRVWKTFDISFSAVSFVTQHHFYFFKNENFALVSRAICLHKLQICYKLSDTTKAKVAHNKSRTRRSKFTSSSNRDHLVTFNG